MQQLPIDDVIPEVLEALRSAGAAVVVAPPGAGKTTRLPPALLPEVPGMIVLLEPRRVAARAAARRIASELGTALGDLVGYHVRFDRLASDRTRILVVTEGLLTRRLQDDPLLSGIDAVIFDEFHERSLHADLGLALAREVRELRPELKILVMSATIDPGPVAAFLEAPCIRSEGRAHPVAVCHLPPPNDGSPPVRHTASVIRRALRDQAGDVLVFLPGIAEIRAAEDHLGSIPGVSIHRLHGDLPAAEQDAALRPGPSRKVILATNVAETSLTIEGVQCVVDTGLARELSHDPWLGMDRLTLGPIPRSSIEQRTGRAGRTGPGLAFRLWSLADEASRPRAALPEVQRVDLSRTVLELAAWGVTRPQEFRWLEAPADADLQRAGRLLSSLGALDPAGRPTPRGRDLLAVPLHPRLAALLLAARDARVLRTGAVLCALLSERDILATRGVSERRGATTTGPSDVLLRLDLWEEARRRHFDATTSHALGVEGRAARTVAEVAQHLERLVANRGGDVAPDDSTLLRLLLAGFPDRVARRRVPGAADAVMVGGRGVRLAPESIVREAMFFLALAADAGARGQANALVRQASAIEPEWLASDMPHAMRDDDDVIFDESKERVIARRRRLYHDLTITESQRLDVSVDEAAPILEAALRSSPGSVVQRDEEFSTLEARLEFLRLNVPELSIPPLDEARLIELLAGHCPGKKSFAELRSLRLSDLVAASLDPRQRQALARDAPTSLPLPSGKTARVRYEAHLAPIVSSRVQDFFGLHETPRLARGRVPCLIELLAPNYRPVQRTQDLRSFWANTYAQVRKDLRGRYPKHPWPENPHAPNDRQPPR